MTEFQALKMLMGDSYSIHIQTATEKIAKLGWPTNTLTRMEDAGFLVCRDRHNFIRTEQHIDKIVGLVIKDVPILSFSEPPISFILNMKGYARWAYLTKCLSLIEKM